MTAATPSAFSSNVRLLISSHCPHCNSVMQHLSDMVKTGTVAHLEIYNVDQAPEIAQEHNIRSIPWIGIGPFELTGARTRQELEDWLAKADTEEGMAAYFAELMSSRQVEKVVDLIEKTPSLFAAILHLLQDPETELVARIGIGVVMETFAGKAPLTSSIDQLNELTSHEDSRVRADSCHYLGLTEDQRAIDILTPLLQDTDTDVRESAADAIEDLQELGDGN